MNEDFCPKLRWPIGIRKVPELQAIVLECPIGLHSQPLVLRQEVGPLLGLFDGTSSLKELVAAYSAQGVTFELLHELSVLLNQNFLLENEIYRERREEFLAEYRGLAHRVPALAGSAYPENPALLRLEIQKYLKVAQGPDSILGVVSPHIDYTRGGSGYGMAYSSFKPQHDILILMGTSHQYGEQKFILSKKNFSTPLGTLSNATEICDEIARRFGSERLYGEEFRHRTEHSLELQLPFLQIAGSRARIVPLLLGSFHSYVQSGSQPEEDSEYQEFVGSVVEVLGIALSEGKRIGFIAGVDMAHVGKQFGDDFLLSQEVMQQIELQDRQYLNYFTNKDSRGLHEHIAEDGDARRVCGYPTLHVLLNLLKGLGSDFSVHELDYQQAVDSKKTCGVTFASLHLENR